MALEFFPFFPDAFLSSTTVSAMSTEAVGAYTLLLCHAWGQSPPGTLPDDDAVLAKWSRLGPAKWRRLKPEIVRAFVKGKDGRWNQPRMIEVHAKVLIDIQKKREAGAKGANKRWHCHSTANARAIAEPMAQPWQNDGNQKLQTPNSAIAEKNPPNPPPGGGSDSPFPDGVFPPAPLNTEAFAEAWRAWVEYRRERRLPAWRSKTLTAKWAEMAGWGLEGAVASIRQSIANGWAGLFAPKAPAPSPASPAPKPRDYDAILDGRASA